MKSKNKITETIKRSSTYANQQPSSVQSEKVQRLVEEGTPSLITTCRENSL